MRYLTKKWGDGAETACLIELTPQDKTLRTLKVAHPALGSGKISGECKAQSIKKHLEVSYP